MTSNRPAAVIVLAAGGGTRMKSALPKPLHMIGGRTLIAHAMTAARGVEPGTLVVVLRHERDRIADHVTELDPATVVADQDEVMGTGRAVECGLAALPSDLTGTVLVTMGDIPLLTAETLSRLTETHATAGAAATVITFTPPDPTGYGRILRDADGAIVGNVEDADATAEQRLITEVNSGLYAFDAAALRSALGRIGTENAKGEKYLTDVLGALAADGSRVGARRVDDAWQTEGVNDRVQLARVGAELNRRTVEHWMRAGVTVVDPATTWVDTDVTLGHDVTIHPQTQIHGASTIGSDVVIGPDTTLADVEIADRASVVRTHATLAMIGADASVGPFAYLRPGTVLGSGGKIGTYVETKNATVGDGAKVPHLSYVGDAEIGAGTNIGAGTIFANYDGVEKHHTTVGAHCKTGSNNAFVAPVEIGDGAATGAGAVVRRDVPPGALAVSSGPQRTIDGWVERKRGGTASARAAEAARAEEEGEAQ
ncbi:MAG: bifunctional UDP-N-acetylglucosamine diphosphorylase/glucosamine-1-phosphate N-acetyltransferase GlmU [Nocardioidaceae bacterium]